MEERRSQSKSTRQHQKTARELKEAKKQLVEELDDPVHRRSARRRGESPGLEEMPKQVEELAADLHNAKTLENGWEYVAAARREGLDPQEAFEEGWTPGESEDKSKDKNKGSNKSKSKGEDKSQDRDSGRSSGRGGRR